MRYSVERVRSTMIGAVIWGSAEGARSAAEGAPVGQAPAEGARSAAEGGAQPRPLLYLRYSFLLLFGYYFPFFNILSTKSRVILRKKSP